ncbi:DUF362 domain-containing protein [Methanosphaerula palustris]|uniref:DUF362 domain-containing protein n=1 Tax=Methanosphaerula palustris (strain ATCC BAA-1556 / DSM 19958 / E1-9c) TaxID=521011 RepID=B8GJS8_METPE|nr:DUF362 domain-containing protein [Methanosphaerula palustris]ACL15732.1 protein of unknown function DUF362 [Methanosphaerula palustris E1-9c]
MKDYLASIIKVSNLHEDIINSLEFIKWKDSIRNGSMVFIKPNFTYPFYKEGITTNPVVLKEILAILKDRAGRVIVGESNGGNHSFTANQAFKGHGMPEICKETGAELVNLSTLPSRFIEDTIQGKRVKVQVPDLLVDEIDCFISVPVLKVHVMTTITLSMKNLWGCYPDTMRCLQHKYLSRKLTLLTKVIKPKIVLIDGTYALNGHGPMYGEPVKTDLLIAANNPVVADAFGSTLMGIPASRVEHIMFAEKEGLGTTDLDAVQFNDDWKKYQLQFQVNKTLIDSLSTILFNSECMAKLVMDSPMKPIIYGVASKLRNKNEQNVVDELEGRD